MSIGRRGGAIRPKWDCRMIMRAFLAPSDGDYVIAQTLS
jgi:hypothetical protein